MNFSSLLNRDIHCACGRTHRCDLRQFCTGSGVLNQLVQMTEPYRRIFLLSDVHTEDVAGRRVRALLGDRVAGSLTYPDEHLVPDEAAEEKAWDACPADADFVLAVGSGVLNDLGKFTAYRRGIPCGIVATAPSMDGFASSGAAMIERGMKVTHTVCAPELILGDTDILCAAPADMIRSGYADIIGKYSALCDWKLAHLVHGEPLCPMIYDTVKDATDEVRSLASALVRRDKNAVGRLFEILVLVGACLTLQGSTRPGSGSEHHLSHYFEITGLLTNRPHLVHGIDVGYASVITARLRQKLAAVEHPRFTRIPDEQRLAAYREIYGPVAPEVWELQKKAGRYDFPLPAAYTEKWEEIRAILSECPTAAEMQTMLTDAGFDGLEFTRCYTKERVEQGVCWGKDLKDRYSVLWLWSETEK